MTQPDQNDQRFERFEGHRPEVKDPSYVAPTARLIGRVSVAERCSIWPGTVLRGDHESITIGRNTNVQDNTVVHPDPGEPVSIGENVTVGHNVVIHACTIGNNVLIGIGAVILNRAVIGDGAVVGAGAVVAEGKVVEPGTMVLGVPAKPFRTLTNEEVVERKNHADRYWRLAERYLKQREKEQAGL